MATQQAPEITSFDGSKYSIDKHSYPLDLVGNYDQYGNTMILFNINVSVDSKLVKGADKNEFVEDFAPRDRGALIGSNFSTKKVLAAFAAASATGGGLLGSLAGGGGAGAAAAGAFGFGAAKYVLPSGGEFTRPQKRLKTAIAMHMPNQLQIRYGMQWQDKETLTETAAIQSVGLGSVAGAVVGGAVAKAVGNSIKGGAGLGYAVGAAAQNPSMAASLGLSNLPGGDVLSAGSGVASNPKQEQIFKGVDFRTFTINYEFYPKSEAEAENVLEIIRTFKFHMHPEFKDERGFLFIYPSEFDIFYFTGKDLNRAIHKHTSCVLADLTVNYTPNGQFTSFPNGMPTQINVQMTFRELAILTKDKIEAGM